MCPERSLSSLRQRGVSGDAGDRFEGSDSKEGEGSGTSGIQNQSTDDDTSLRGDSIKLEADPGRVCRIVRLPLPLGITLIVSSDVLDVKKSKSQERRSDGTGVDRGGGVVSPVAVNSLLVTSGGRDTSGSGARRATD